LKKIYNSFLTCFGLISRIPIKIKYNTDFSMFGLFFPFIGLIVSFLVLGLYLLLNPLISQSGIIVFIILIFQYFSFNLFHFDGLLDCADAFLYNTTKDKRLIILTDKRTGSFAIFSGAVYLFIKIYLLNESITILSFNGSNWIWLFTLFSYPLSGRIAGALMPVIIPPAEDPGLAELLKDYPIIFVTIGILLTISVPITVFLLFEALSKILILLIPFSGAVIAGVSVSLVSKKLLGGYTGDSIGLAIETGELIHLIILFEIIGRFF
jgi:adenosylcobinamide-GDP ribazoletransferase